MTALVSKAGPVPTPAGIRAVLLEAARIIESVGHCQHQAEDLTGAVCARRALTLASDGDLELAWFAAFEVERLLEACGLVSDLTEWQDHPQVGKDAVVRLLRATAVCPGRDWTKAVAA